MQPPAPPRSPARAGRSRCSGAPRPRGSARTGGTRARSARSTRRTSRPRSGAYSAPEQPRSEGTSRRRRRDFPSHLC